MITGKDQPEFDVGCKLSYLWKSTVPEKETKIKLNKKVAKDREEEKRIKGYKLQ